MAKDKTDKFGVHRYGSGPQFGMYAIVAVCRSQFGAAGYDGDPNDIVQSVLAKWIGFEEYAIKQPHNSSYFRVYNDPETGTEKTDWNFNNYYKGRTLLSDLKAYFA